MASNESHKTVTPELEEDNIDERPPFSPNGFDGNGFDGCGSHKTYCGSVASFAEEDTNQLSERPNSTFADTCGNHRSYTGKSTFHNEKYVDSKSIKYGGMVMTKIRTEDLEENHDGSTDDGTENESTFVSCRKSKEK